MRTLLSVLTVLALAAAVTGCGSKDNGTIEASGTIEGTEINVAAEVAGRILAVPVNEGARVKPGDTLALINDEEYRLQLQQADANLASLDAAYRLALEGSRKEDVIQAEAAYTSANADYLRMKDLLASATITQKQYDDAYARFVAADQTYRKVKSGLRPEEINGARARRDAAAAQVDLLKKRIRDCAVVSPAPGTLTLRAVEPGELVGMGSNIARLTYLDRVKLTIYVNEARTRTRGTRSACRCDDRYVRCRQTLQRHSGVHLSECGIHAEERTDQGRTDKAGFCREDRDRKP